MLQAQSSSSDLKSHLTKVGLSPDMHLAKDPQRQAPRLTPDIRPLSGFCPRLPPPDAPDAAIIKMLDDDSITYLDDLLVRYSKARLFDLINFDLGHPHPKPDIDMESGMWIGKYREIEKNIPAPMRVMAAADGTG